MAGPGDLKKLMEQAQQMQQRMQEAQKQLAEMEVDGVALGGKVTVRVNGKHYTKKVTIDPSLMDEEDKEMLEDLIAAAYNDATGKIEKASREQVSKLTSGIDLPPGAFGE